MCARGGGYWKDESHYHMSRMAFSMFRMYMNSSVCTYAPPVSSQFLPPVVCLRWRIRTVVLSKWIHESVLYVQYYVHFIHMINK